MKHFSTLVVLLLWGFASLSAQVQAPSLADSLDAQASACSDANDPAAAVTLAERAVALRARQDGEHNASFGHSANRLSKYLSYVGRLKEAIDWGTRSLAIAAETEGKRSATYAQYLSDLAGYYSRSGQYAEALRHGTEALVLRDSLLGQEHPAYAQSLNNVARYHSYLGNYMDAIRLGRKAMELKASQQGKEHAEYARSESNLAGYLARIGDYEEAIRLGEDALRIREQTLGKRHPDYAQSLNNLAKYHYFIGEYDTAIRLEKEALAVREALYGREHPEYATALGNLADYYQMTGNTAEAMRCGSEALHIRERVLGTNHPDYAESLNSLAGYHYASGNAAEAIVLEAQALALQKHLLGEEHPAYARSLCKMAIYCSANQQATEAESYAFEATSQYTDVILNTFADLTTNERDLFWTKAKPWFTNTLLQLTEKNPSDKMVSSAYNATLLAKGLLLKSEQEMVNLLMESGDSIAVKAYRKLQADRALLLQEFEKPRDRRQLNTDSLQRLITREERRLVKRSKTYGNYTQSLRIEWNRIARLLRSDDVAIEFVHYLTAEGQGRYAALVVSPGSRHPSFVALMSDEELKALPAKTLYTSPQLSSLLWRPLSPYLEKAKRIYFAPAGELYNIAIESLPIWQATTGGGDEVMSDRWRLYRLSSTREIALGHGKTRKPPTSATIFGGMTYDAKPLGGKGTPRQVRKSLKGAAKYLPATRKEAEESAGLLRQHAIPVALHLGDSATEQTLKHLSGHAPSILHIATHGFYWTDSEVRQGNMSEKLQFLSMYGHLDDADQALTRSGLLFSGANHTLRGERQHEQADDGVLTAKEISLLDLRGLDLLVLSACQTGLGKVTGDGVFGLQRGFKKAGAGALLMSLWKVDDVATRLLMTQFYTYLMQGMGKHEALRRAQHYLRELEVDTGSKRGRHAISSRQKRARKNSIKKPYRDPYYWAAFILLDGLDGRLSKATPPTPTSPSKPMQPSSPPPTPRVRPASQAGRFYERNAQQLGREVDQYLSRHATPVVGPSLAALIVPHAGYYYSGNVAAAAYKAIDPNRHYQRIFLLGPSHQVWLDGASVDSGADRYATPLGQVEVDHATIDKLLASTPLFTYREEAHAQEHCLEVQLPFLQRRLKQMPPIVPIIIATNDFGHLQKIARALQPYLNEDNLFVVSSDFSHYPSYDDACQVDGRTRDAILTGNVEQFIAIIEANARSGIRNLSTSACGAFAIITMMLMLGSQHHIHHLLYQNSGDIGEHDHHRVVGYHAFTIVRDEDKARSTFTLTDEEKQLLKRLARESIASAFDGKRPNSTTRCRQHAALSQHCGAFVTLTQQGRLRGCIGHFGEDAPLYEMVAEMARAAAFEDPRFSPLRRNELSGTEIEISVLTPMRRIHSLDEFELHRHGIYIRKGHRSGTFLPQVADEVNWTKEEFVGHCSQDKAGLGWNGWRDAELYVYEAIVF